MTDKKLIVIAGATGAQGGGLAKAILDDANSPFTVRALTRNVNSDKAKALAARGAEVVAADVDDLESLKAAFSGAYGAFCVTFFWEHFSPEKEYQHATNMAEAAKVAGVKHVIWSTLEDTRKYISLNDSRMPTLLEKYKVPHFDAKGEADARFTELGVPTTFLRTAYYWENLIDFGMGSKRAENGSLALVMPMGDRKLPSIAVEDIGKSAYEIFKRGNEFIGKTVGIAGEHLTGKDMAEKLGSALGEPVVYNAVPFDVYRAFAFPGADDLGNMFQFNHDFEREFCGARDLGFSKQLNPKMQSFDDWLSRNVTRIPIE